ncbi:hypothetical protein BU17DRAFT_72225 [Hysterangium stoloniferum]|nr:hypothetical protein BU17DRAFT_72225 [Hysterangium stoloniferum]
MFAWGAVLVWGEIGGTNSTERVTQPATRVTQPGQIFFCVAFNKLSKSQKLVSLPTVSCRDPRKVERRGSITVAATAHGCRQPEALSFVTSTDGDHQPRQQDLAPCPKTPKQSVPAIFEALLTPHQLARKQNRISDLSTRFGFGFGFGEVGRWLGE